jgi:hypothetical protein
MQIIDCFHTKKQRSPGAQKTDQDSTKGRSGCGVPRMPKLYNLVFLETWNCLTVRFDRQEVVITSPGDAVGRRASLFGEV